MKRTSFIIALSLVLAAPTASMADSRIAKLCGPDHANEVASGNDIRPNPVGFFVASLAEQVGDRDPRVILTTDDVFYLCTQAAATPAMDTSNAMGLSNKRRVKYLLVPGTRRSAGS